MPDLHLLRRAALGFVGLLAFAALGVAPSGCNIIVPVSYVIEGPGTIPAEFTLRETTTAVFIDDRNNDLPRTALRAMVGVEITQRLIDNDAVPGSMLVDSRDVMALVRSLETSDRRVSIERIAREAGVEQLIYVEVKGFALTLDGFTPRPTAVASIKVLDVAADTKVFPGGGNPGGREVVGQVREVDPSNYQSFAKRRRVEDDLAFKLGETVAELFYEHERIDLGENLGIR